MSGVPQPLTPTEFSSAVTAITSAFGDPTRREIYLFVHECSEAAGEDGPAGVTAGEVAERFALHPNVARHHLDKLAGGGYVEVATGRTGTGAGRPSKRYRVTSPEMSLEVPVRHDDERHCTPWPTRCRRTGSRPAPSSTATNCGSSASTARSAARPSSTP